MKLLVSSLLAFLLISAVAASPRRAPVRRARSITVPKSKITEKDGKIYNAEGNALPGELPYVACIIVNTAESYAAGTLISSRSVLTTAQDIVSGSSWTVTLGATVMTANEPWRKSYTVATATPYPTYPSSYSDNIGVIHLPEDVEDGYYISSALLPTRTDQNNDFANYAAVVAGFGYIGESGPYSEQLRYTRLEIITNEECMPIYGATPQDICAKGVGTICLGDYGAGLVLTNPVTEARKVVGVAAYTGICEHTNPTLYTRVTSYLDWVADTAGIEVLP